MPERLFISHASEDAAVAERIVAYLEARGASCWISSRDIPPRAIYADAIAEGMEGCSACVVILSAASNQSKAVKRELELASHYDKPFVPIRIDATEPARGFDYYLRNTQWVDYRREGESALDRISGTGSNARARSPKKTAARTPIAERLGWLALLVAGALLSFGLGFFNDGLSQPNEGALSVAFQIAFFSLCLGGSLAIGIHAAARTNAAVLLLVPMAAGLAGLAASVLVAFAITTWVGKYTSMPQSLALMLPPIASGFVARATGARLNRQR
ncbi:MAG TPA: toll/interleukin-1 receptor domain-containing protein [Caulobacterales bacterium]|nr:toll/interleukin-1 receptor domain-containing protein [Caulobacterales bacterium]